MTDAPPENPECTVCPVMGECRSIARDYRKRKLRKPVFVGLIVRLARRYASSMQCLKDEVTP